MVSLYTNDTYLSIRLNRFHCNLFNPIQFCMKCVVWLCIPACMVYLDTGDYPIHASNCTHDCLHSMQG